MSLLPIFFIFGCFFYATAVPEPSSGYKPKLPDVRPPPFNPKASRPYRFRRFTDGNSRIFDGQNPPEQKQPEWEVRPDLSRDDRGNTKGRVSVKNHGDNHDFEAEWGQNLRGPDKHSETWRVGGSIKW